MDPRSYTSVEPAPSLTHLSPTDTYSNYHFLDESVESEITEYVIIYLCNVIDGRGYNSKIAPAKFCRCKHRFAAEAENALFSDSFIFDEYDDDEDDDCHFVERSWRILGQSLCQMINNGKHKQRRKKNNNKKTKRWMTVQPLG